MGHQPLCTMNPPPGSGKSTPATANNRSSGYRQKALAEIRNSLLPFAHSGEGGGGVGSSAASTISTLSTTSGVSSVSSSLSNGHSNGGGGSLLLDKDLNGLRQALNQLIAMGYSEDMSLMALKMTDGRYEAALNFLHKQGDLGKLSSGKSKQLMRKPSLERGSPVLDSGAGSSRSDSPRQILDMSSHPPLSRQYSPSSFSSEPPPPPPPRTSSTPPPPITHHVHMSHHMLKRLSPAPAPVLPQRGPGLTMSPEPPPPYPSPAAAPPPPPSYSASIQSRQSPAPPPSPLLNQKKKKIIK
uniref:UBA domain-containing protein n=1 Tax=Cacopsylla melanoneura TaxID=428564 RepID=A0A8D8ZFT1_9HEMI